MYILGHSDGTKFEFSSVKDAIVAQMMRQYFIYTDSKNNAEMNRHNIQVYNAFIESSLVALKRYNEFSVLYNKES